MNAIVNSCVNKCDYITQVYNQIINRQYGTECCTKNKITLCDLLLACNEVLTINIPEIITIDTYCESSTICDTFTTNVISVSCNKITLIEL